jgi:dihydrofolate synthase / folylpolyglutamate synthase
MAIMEQGQGLGPALERLYQRRAFGIKPGLDAVRKLCDLTGHPESAFACIHVAGTNGKGSTAAMLEAVLRATGLRPGLYTSPHLVRFNERIRLDGSDADDVQLAASLERCEAVASRVQLELGHEVTFFEVATVMAFLCMQEAGIRLAVLETGLGGRLDATNVVTPLVSVITRIGMDHEEYLGTTLAAIAGEKAGIIKPGRPVVSAPQEPEAAAVLCAVAAAQGAPLVFAPDVVSIQALGPSQGGGQKVRIETQCAWSGQLVLPLSGIHQLENLGVALAALEIVFGQLQMEVPIETIRKGLAGIRWPARMQMLQQDPDVLLDAAHNPDGAAVLVKSLRAQGWPHVVLVTGMCADKDVEGVVVQFAGIARRVYCCPLPGERGMAPAQLAQHYERQRLEACVCATIQEALASATGFARQAGLPVVIAGSLFLAGAVLEQGVGVL